MPYRREPQQYDEYVKFTKKLIIYVPEKPSKKTKAYTDWLYKKKKGKKCSMPECEGMKIKYVPIYVGGDAWGCSNKNCLFYRGNGWPLWLVEGQNRQFSKDDIKYAMKMGKLDRWNIRWMNMHGELIN